MEPPKWLVGMVEQSTGFVAICPDRKLLITLAGGIVTCIVLAVIPVVLLLPGRLPIDKISLIVVYVWHDHCRFARSGSLFLFGEFVDSRDTRCGLVIAGLGLSVASRHYCNVACDSVNRLVRWGLTPDFASFFITFVSSLGILAIGMVAMLIAFHWRWTTGQRTVFQFREARCCSGTVCCIRLLNHRRSRFVAGTDQTSIG